MKQIRTQDSFDEAVLPEVFQTHVSRSEDNLSLEKNDNLSKGGNRFAHKEAASSYREDDRPHLKKD